MVIVIACAGRLAGLIDLSIGKLGTRPGGNLLVLPTPGFDAADAGEDGCRLGETSALWPRSGSARWCVAGPCDQATSAITNASKIPIQARTRFCTRIRGILTNERLLTRCGRRL